jgi:hypothetical protein
VLYFVKLSCQMEVFGTIDVENVISAKSVIAILRRVR